MKEMIYKDDSIEAIKKSSNPYVPIITNDFYIAVKAIEELPSAEPDRKTEWIFCKDQMPSESINDNTHDFEYVLCATTFGDVRPYKYGTPWGYNGPHFWHGAGIMDEYVTHWMPLPSPPNRN